MNISRRSLASVSKQKSRICVVRSKSKDVNHSIFQLNNTSRFISLNDVKDALEVTRSFSAHQRLKYFSERGIHYSRALRYVRLVEQFEEAFAAAVEKSYYEEVFDTTQLYNQSYEEEEERDSSFSRPPTSLSSEDIGRFIAEAMEERDEHENAHIVGEAKPYLKEYNDAMKMSNSVEYLGIHAKNIGLLIIVIMFIHFLCDEWSAYIGKGT